MPLQRVLYHSDHQTHVLQQLERDDGSRVRVTAFTEEHVFFLVDILDASPNMFSFLAAHEVVTYKVYIARCSTKCEALAE